MRTLIYLFFVTAANTQINTEEIQLIIKAGKIESPLHNNIQVLTKAGKIVDPYTINWDSLSSRPDVITHPVTSGVHGFSIASAYR